VLAVVEKVDVDVGFKAPDLAYIIGGRARSFEHTDERAYVSIRQHTSADASRLRILPTS
jgi:hypothetical protein